MPDPHRALEWLSQRHSGESAALIAAHAGVSEEVVLDATRALGPFPRPTRRSGAPSLPTDTQVDERRQRWVELRRSGHATTAIARAEGTTHQLVSRATCDHGPFPAPETVEQWVAARRSRRTIAQIAEDFGVPSPTIRRATAAHGPFPLPGARLPDGVMGVASVAARVGLSLPSVLRWRATGRLPGPDFVTARGRELWLPGTIETWLSTAELSTCRVCGARCASLAHHRSAAH